MKDSNNDFDRRSVLKTVGAAGIAGVGLTGVVSAEQTDLVEETEELEGADAISAYRSALSTESGKAIREFLVGKSASLDSSRLEGHVVDPAGDAPRHKVLDVPLESANREDGLLSIRLFDDNASATVLLGESSYRTNPGIRKELEEDVVPVERWVTYKQENLGDETQRVSTQISVGLNECVTADPHDDCYILGGIAFLGAVTLVIVPEPSSTAAGAAYSGAVAAEALLGTSGGACAFTKIIDEHIATGCNYSEIEMCLDWSSSVGWDGVSWELEVTATPVDC
ncbi:hypothetical protein [Natrinema marinum]|uniref:hypothetical protein n=1 Tax=Natrinema marinum TaxID=2961598 RepID=UPI0020C93883|nr:hypothetical protein [Natrinema marinum]